MRVGIYQILIILKKYCKNTVAAAINVNFQNGMPDTKVQDSNHARNGAPLK